jgi:hypothetical protein
MLIFFSHVLVQALEHSRSHWRDRNCFTRQMAAQQLSHNSRHWCAFKTSSDRLLSCWRWEAQFFFTLVCQMTVGVHFRQWIRCFKNGENGGAELRANRGVVELGVAVIPGKIRLVDGRIRGDHRVTLCSTLPIGKGRVLQIFHHHRYFNIGIPCATNVDRWTTHRGNDTNRQQSSTPIKCKKWKLPPQIVTEGGIWNPDVPFLNPVQSSRWKGTTWHRERRRRKSRVRGEWEKVITSLPRWGVIPMNSVPVGDATVNCVHCT